MPGFEDPVWVALWNLAYRPTEQQHERPQQSPNPCMRCHFALRPLSLDCSGAKLRGPMQVAFSDLAYGLAKHRHIRPQHSPNLYIMMRCQDPLLSNLGDAELREAMHVAF